jgi:hypothetical protein
MNLLVFGMCGRLVVRLLIDAEGGMPVTSGFTESLMESVALRLITVGVVMLERNEILEMVGKTTPPHGHDRLASLSQPYGMFYLCGGLIMECFVDALKHPFYIIDGPMGKSILLSVVLLFSLISLIISVKYACDLLVWRTPLRGK